MEPDAQFDDVKLDTPPIVASFRRYRMMSFITGTTLLTLFATLLLHTVDFSAWKHIELFVDVVGIGHGVVLYPIYFVMCFMFAVRARLNLGLLVLMLLAGFVPGLAFYMEHYVGTKLGLLAKKATNPYE